MTDIPAYELVRKDLLNHDDLELPPVYYTGPGSLQDTYAMALELVCCLRQIIEDRKL